MNEQDKLHGKPSAEETGTGTEDPEARDDAGNPDETPAEPLEAEAERERVGEDPPEETEPDEVAELKDKLLRSLADMENLRRRSQKDRDDASKYGVSNFARDMLSVADNLRRAIDSLPPDEESGAMAGFVEGVALTEKEMLSSFERHGIGRIDPAGEKFDPRFHEAMFELPTAEADPGTVVQILEVGYRLHDRLLRPAKVAVAKEPAEPPAESASDPGEASAAEEADGAETSPPRS